MRSLLEDKRIVLSLGLMPSRLACRRPIREIKASGGFLSFDPMVAHFGMGEHRCMDRIEIRWSTGEQTELRGPFPVGARYRITRVLSDSNRSDLLAEKVAECSNSTPPSESGIPKHGFSRHSTRAAS